MSESIQTQGKTVNEAVSEALLQLGLRRDEVEIKVLEEPKSGLLGFIGGRPAKVMVRKKPSRGGRGRGRGRNDDNEAHSLGRGRGGRGRGGRGRGGRSGQQDKEQDNRQEARGGRGGRGGQSRQDGNQENNEARAESRSRGGRGRGGRGRGRDGGEGRQDNGRQDNRRRDGGRQEDARQNNERQESSRQASARPDNTRQDNNRQDENRPDNTRQESRGSSRGGRSRRGRRGDQLQETRQPEAQAQETREADGNQNESRREERPTRRGGRGRGGRSRRHEQQDTRQDDVTTRSAQVEETPVEAQPAPTESPRKEQPAAEVAAVTPKPEETKTMSDDRSEKPVSETSAPAASAEPATPVAKPKKKSWGGGLGSRLPRKDNPQAKKKETIVIAEAPEVSSSPRRESRPTGDRDRSRGGRDNYRRDRDERYTAASAADEVIISEVAATKYAKPIGETTEENMNSVLGELTGGMLARAGFACDVDVVDGEYRQVRIASDDEDSAGLLIGRHGQTVDAVEHLVERMASNAIDDRVRMNLDINDYRLRRQDALSERVADAIAEVRETGKPYHVESMSARERRLVHLEVEPIEGIRTFTMMGNGGKHVVIALDDDGGEGADRDHNED